MPLVLQPGTTLREFQRTHEVSLDWLQQITGADPDTPLDSKLIIAQPPSAITAENAAALPVRASSLTASNALLQHAMMDFGALRKEAAQVIHHGPEDAFHFKEGIDVTELYNTPDNPKISIAQTDVNPGVTTALHRLDVQEVQRIVKGHGVIELDGEKHDVGPGDLVVIPRGTAQRITNTGDHVLRMDCTCTPRFTEEVYNHLADPIIDAEAAARAAGVVATVPRFGLHRSDAFSGKVAVVTGGNRGMGLELCRQLGMQGFTVVLTARNARAGEAAASKLRREGLDVVFELVDVTKAADANRLAAVCQDRFGRADVLINNAGANFDGTDLDALDKQMRSMELNTYGPMRLTQALTPLLAVTGGRVVNTSSELASSEFAELMFPAYQAAKTALNMQSRALAPALLEQGIHLNLVDPGWVQTDMGGSDAPDSKADGVQAALWLATTDDPPSGGFSRRYKGAEPPDGMVQIATAAW